MRMDSIPNETTTTALNELPMPEEATLPTITATPAKRGRPYPFGPGSDFSPKRRRIDGLDTESLATDQGEDGAASSEVATLPLNSSYFDKRKNGATATTPPPSALLVTSSPVTQPTQLLDPNRTPRTAPPVVQVAASSPFREELISPVKTKLFTKAKPTPAALQPDGSVRPFDFYPSKPNGVGNVDLTDDAPHYLGGSSDEGSDHDIKPTFVGSALASKAIPSVGAMRDRRDNAKSTEEPTRIEESPVSIRNLQKFVYNPSAKPQSAHIPFQGRLDSVKRPTTKYSSGTATIAGSRPRNQTNGYSGIDIKVSEIENKEYQNHVRRMSTVLPMKPIRVLLNALMEKKGNYDEAMAVLTEDDEDAIGLTGSGDEKPASRVAQMKTSNRAAAAPRGTIRDKWSSTQAQAQVVASPEPAPKPRRRLVKGASREVSSSPPAPAHFDDDTDSAGQYDGNSDEERYLEDKVLKYVNTCTLKELSDISCTAAETVKVVIAQRPFRSLDEVRAVTSDVAPVKGKKSRGARTRAIGDKIVDICLETWRGYDAVDSLIAKVEELGKPVAESIKKWGVDIFGSAGAGGELEILDVNPDSGVASLKDSAIGTPTDSLDDGDEIKGTRRENQIGNFFKQQPKNMAEGVILKDYQVVGVNWLNLLYEKKLSCILADEMGLGKTCQVIAFLARLLEGGIKGPHLVVVPSSTLENWLREFKRFCPALIVEPYYGSLKERAEMRISLCKRKDWNVLVTTYQLATGDRIDKRFLKDQSFNVCVYDEGHLLKNSASNRYDALMRLPAVFRLLLTGTPLQNNLQELASLLAFILPEVFNEKREDLASIFKYKAKTTDNEESNNALLSIQRIKRARAMMTPFVLRRKKQQVLKHLPGKTSRVEYCVMNKAQESIYKHHLDLAAEAIAAKAAGKKASKSNANVMMQLRQAAIHPLLFRRHYTDAKILQMSHAILGEETYKNCSQEIIYEDMEVMNDLELNKLCVMNPKTLGKHALKRKEWMGSGKVEAMIKLLMEMREKGDRVLIFSQFTQVLDLLELVMTTLGLGFLRIDGSTPVDMRQDMIDQYHEEEDIMTFLLSTKAGGFGINLACANRVVIFDSSFNPHDDAQASDRAHRVGQTREVEVIRLVTKGTIEEQILALANTKLALDQSISEDDNAVEGKAQEMVAKMLLQAEEERGKKAEESEEKAEDSDKKAGKK
ncbi:hypothetical protein L873DRAFT_1257244 [Choiromyces venosus 120613-1]|uniref:DNA helicase n=1 Tax=Choiromyces venosus 120613-1 TaxID=1336337 RepID=A0A3N4JD70_9PEZI|nr:hypothetical protein L873DRAFT_1257244 [Choiromyces venosus 120613-1]